MASPQYLRLIVPKRSISWVRPYHWKHVQKQPTCRWISAAIGSTEIRESLSIHELVSQGRYCEAVDQWELAKEEGATNVRLYASVMKMAAEVGGAEAARHVREDMEGQGWNMDHDCSLHYLKSLVKEGLVTDAMKFIKSSHFKEDSSFLVGCASVLLEAGQPAAALDVCALSPLSLPLPPPSLPPPSLPSPSLPPPVLLLLSVQLEAMGTLGMEKEIEEMERKLCGDGAPPELVFAVANGFSLAGHPSRALSLLRPARLRHSVPMKSLALIMESALREQDYSLAAEAHSLFWNTSTVQPGHDAIASSPSCLSHHTTHHCRAITAAFYLQALAHRNNTLTGEGRVRSFLERDFSQELTRHKYPPSPDMYKALLLLSCYHTPAIDWANTLMKHCRATGQTVPAASLTSWARECGTLTPHQAVRVIHLVRAHRHHYQLNFDLSHYADLLSIRYHSDSIIQQKEALDCIRAIKNSMDKWGLLFSTEAYNLVLEAVTHIPAVGAHYTTFNDMTSAAHDVEPDLATFHLLLDGTLAEGSVKNTKKSAYYLWRTVMKEWPRVRPDVELVNKFVRCCLVCGDSERGLVFLSALSDCSIEPDVHTFTLLLRLCHSGNDRQNFESVLKLAEHCLPHQRAQIRATAHELQRQWRTEEDIDLAQSILSSHLSSI